jgi:hypothetical protein
MFGAAILIITGQLLYDILCIIFSKEEILGFIKEVSCFTGRIPIYLTYYVIVWLGAKFSIKSSGGSELLVWQAIGSGWFCVTLMAFNEFYSLVRYWFISRGFKQSIITLEYS